MLFWISRPLRLIGQAFYETCTPRHIALGASLGMMIGLLPKENLTTFALAIVLLASRFNLLAGVVSILAFSWLGLTLDSYAHNVGHWVLHVGALESTYAWLYTLPIVPWTSLNNTVVVGQLLFGITLFAPMYFGAKAAADRWLKPASEWVSRNRLLQFLFGADVASSWRIG